MTTLCHLFDVDSDWEERVAVEQWRQRLPPDQATQRLATLHPRKPHLPPSAIESDDTDPHAEPSPVHHFPIRFNLPATAAPALKRFLAEHKINLLNAWGLAAAETAITATAESPSVPELPRVPELHSVIVIHHRFDPNLTDRDARRIRTLAESPRFAVACATQTVRRRLIEKGLPESQCVVIRPGVDFAKINRARKHRNAIRQSLNLDPDNQVLLAPFPIHRADGVDRVIWAAQLKHYLDSNSRLIVFGDSPETRRLKALSDGMPFAHCVRWIGPNHRYEELIPAADALVAATQSEASTTAIAWAMAASVPVIAAANYATAELIAHKQNGLLVKPDPGPPMAITIARELKTIPQLAQQREAARGQAFQAFGLRRYIDQNIKLYDNLRAGIAPNTDIQDSALDL
jgi:glycosyltransferase involved in cell wall biosynthesis